MSKILIDEAVVRDTLEVLEKYSGVDQRACDVEEAINQAIADAALDKMAENARELGLSYEQPAQQEHVTDGSPCWCNPELDYKDPDTGAEVWIHKEPQ